MQRVTCIPRLAVLRPGVQTPQHLQTGLLDPAQQLLACAQAEVLGQIRQDQPAFAACAQVCGQAREEASQHGALRVIDGQIEY